MKKAHNVFHVSKLKTYKEPLGRKRTLSVVFDADGTMEEEVKAILRKKREQRKLFYLVQFMGESESKAIWLHKSRLKHCQDLVQEFEKSTRTSIPKKR